VANSCEHCSEHLGSIRRGEFRDQMSDCEVLKKDPAKEVSVARVTTCQVLNLHMLKLSWDFRTHCRVLIVRSCLYIYHPNISFTDLFKVFFTMWYRVSTLNFVGRI
jgi:hypothetical protein